MPQLELLRLRKLASMLGWTGLTRFQHVIRDDTPCVSKDQIIHWYESGSIENIMLQINADPSYHAAVYAIRYRICSGWHSFFLYQDENRQQREAQRLEGWLGHRWFDSLTLRREYRTLHPACTGYTFRKLRDLGPPYDYSTS